MWPFKRKISEPDTGPAGPRCTHCGSSNTRIVVFHGSGADAVRTWRGQRYLTCRCSACGKDFYIEANQVNNDQALPDGNAIDEEALQEAEDEIKRQTDRDNDRTYH